MYEPLTHEELQAIDGMLPQDKELITNILRDHEGLEDNIRLRVLRGYLVSFFLRCEIGDPLNEIREELEGDAGSFCDG